MSRSIVAILLLVGTAGLLWYLWNTAWDALTDLPSKGALEAASQSVVKAIERKVPAPAQRTDNARAQSTQARSNVRFVERDGIVGVRVSGPLERAPAKVKVDPPAPPRIEPDLYRLVVINAAGEIYVRTHTIKLAFVDAPEANAECTREDGVKWPCGRRARTAMRRLIRRRAIACDDRESDDTPDDAPVRAAECRVGKVNLSEWLIEQGWAEPTDTAPELWRELHLTAKAEQRGMYSPAAR